MTFTATRVTSDGLPYRIVGAERETITDIALSSAYPVAGEPVTAANLGLNTVHSAIATLKTTATTTVNLANANYDPATSKLLLFDETPAAVADNADMTGAVIRIRARGKGGGV